MRRAVAIYPHGSWPEAETAGAVTLPYHDRHRRRVRMRDDNGKDFLLDLPQAAILGDGDGLALDGGGYIRVRAAPEAVADIAAGSPEHLARLAWHIGNRHVPVQVLQGGALRILDDHVNHCVADALASGDPAQAEQVFAPVRAQEPALYGIHELPYPMLQAAFDGLYPPGHQWYWRADFVNELSDEAIARHVEHGSQLPTMQSSMHLYPIDGAVHRVGRKDTPFVYRDARWASVIVGVDPDPANRDRITSWCKNYWEALHPHSAGGAYVNFMMDEGQERVRATYRDHYDRLAQIKRKYDPANLFRVNQNIQPAG